MKIPAVVVTVFVIALSTTAHSQEVVITDFPIGIAGSVDRDLFGPYAAKLRALADTMARYPKGVVIVTGSADGITYRSNHDAKNPGLALGRAHVVRNLLIAEYGIDSLQIAVQTEDSQAKGGQYRSVSVRVVKELFEPVASTELSPDPHRIEAIPDHAETAAPVIIKQMGLQFGVGVTSSPFGGIPFGAAALSWRRIIFVEASLGYTFWNDDYRLGATTLDTRRRISGARLIVYPFESLPIGVVGGWSRVEDLSQDYYQYVRLSEGLELGLRATPISFASLTAVYNPSMRRQIGLSRASAENDQFQVSFMLHTMFGGDR